MLNVVQTGRMGEEAPAENIIATLVAVTGSYAFPLAVPFVHRYSRSMVVRTVLSLTFLSALSVAVFSSREVFDEMHQKRLFVIHMENVGASDWENRMQADLLYRLRTESNTCMSVPRIALQVSTSSPTKLRNALVLLTLVLFLLL